MDKEKINEYLNTLGLEYTADFVPWIESRNKPEKNCQKTCQDYYNKMCLNWKIKLKKFNIVLETDYTQGIGYIEILDDYTKKCNKKSLHYFSVIEEICNTRKNSLYRKLGKTWNQAPKQPHPELIDVMYSLLLDADVLHFGDFEDWCSCFGYDTDSRKAEKIYNECLRIALKFIAMIGYDEIEKLRNLYSDY